LALSFVCNLHGYDEVLVEQVAVSLPWY